MKRVDTPRKLLAAAALLALLAASTPTLAETLAGSNIPACCNSAICPLHRHGQGRQGMSDCGAAGSPSGTPCSMRTCDPGPDQAVGIAPFVLVAPVTVVHKATEQPAPFSFSLYFPFVDVVPSTPPPRTFPS